MKKFFVFCLVFGTTLLNTRAQDKAVVISDVLRIKLSNATQNDETVVRFKAEATYNYDSSIDAYKMITSGVPQIYTVSADGSNLSINCIPPVSGTYDIPLNIKIYTDGNYTTTASGFSSFNANICFFMIDQIAGLSKFLRRDSVYTFASLASQTASRFILRIVNRPANPAVFTAVGITETQINLSAQANASNDSIVVVYNANGTFTAPYDLSAPGALNTAFAGGTIFYKGPAANLPNHSGLSSGQHVYYKAFSFNSQYLYSTGSTANSSTAHPSIGFRTASLSFANQLINTTSTEQLDTVFGSYLSAPLIVYPSAHFQISSTSGVGFLSRDSIVLNPVNGSVPNTIIYIRFLPTSVTTYSESLHCSSAGASTQYVSLGGHGVRMKKLYIKTLLEGLYDANNNVLRPAMDGNTNTSWFGGSIADQLSVELHADLSPYALVGQYSNINVNTSAWAEIEVAPDFIADYYLKINSRNHVDVWSAVPLSFAADTITYDFSSSALQAFQSMPEVEPQVQVSLNQYALYVGDLDHNGWIDSDDFNAFEPHLTNGSVGFYDADFNGSGWVDSDDFNLFEPRLTFGVMEQRPY